jgi:hypothetical protein
MVTNTLRYCMSAWTNLTYCWTREEVPNCNVNNIWISCLFCPQTTNKSTWQYSRVHALDGSAIGTGYNVITERLLLTFGVIPSPFVGTHGTPSYLTSPWSGVLFEEMLVTQLFSKFPAFYGTPKFITVFTTARHLVPMRSQMNPVHNFSSYFSKIHLFLSLPSGLFPSGFLTKILYAFLIFPMRTVCPKPG